MAPDSSRATPTAELIHQHIAEIIVGDADLLRCTSCDRAEHLTIASAARYLAHGWPTCHGRTMTLTAQHGDPTGFLDSEPEQ